MKITSANKTGWLLAALAGLSMIAYGAGEFLPRQRRVRELRQQAEASTQYATRSSGSAVTLSHASEELGEAKRFLAAWRKSAPGEDSLNTLFREIDQLAQNFQMRNLRLEPAPVQELAAIWRMPVKIAGEGKYPDLAQFVRGLETLSPAIWITQLHLEEEPRGENLRISLTLTIFGAKREFSDQADLAN